MVEGDQDAGATGRTDGAAAGWGWGSLAAWAAIASGLVGLGDALVLASLASARDRGMYAFGCGAGVASGIVIAGGVWALVAVRRRDAPRAFRVLAAIGVAAAGLALFTVPMFTLPLIEHRQQVTLQRADWQSFAFFLAPAVLPPLVAVLAGFAAVRIRIGAPPGP